MSDERPRSIRGINFTQEQYDKIVAAQERHDKECQVFFDEYSAKCDASQKILDVVWNKCCEENQR